MYKLYAVVESVQANSRQLLAASALDFLAEAPVTVKGSDRPSVADRNAVASAFADGLTASEALRGSLLRLAYQLHGAGSWLQCRQVLRALCDREDMFAADARKMLRNSYIQQSLAMYEAGDTNQAINVLAQWLATESTDNDGWFRALSIVEAAIGGNRFDEARSWLQVLGKPADQKTQAVWLRLEREARIGPGRERLAQGNFDDAAQLLVPILQQYPSDEELRAQLLSPIRQALTAGHWQAVMNACSSLSHTDPVTKRLVEDLLDEAARQAMSTLSLEIDPGSAIRVLTQLLENHPDNPTEIRKQLSHGMWAAVSQADWEAATTAFAALLSHDPDRVPEQNLVRTHEALQHCIAKRVAAIDGLDHVFSNKLNHKVAISEIDASGREIETIALDSIGTSVGVIWKYVRNSQQHRYMTSFYRSIKSKKFSHSYTNEGVGTHPYGELSCDQGRAFLVTSTASGWNWVDLSRELPTFNDGPPSTPASTVPPALLSQVKTITGLAPLLGAAVSNTGLFVAVVDFEFKIHFFRRSLGRSEVSRESGSLADSENDFFERVRSALR